MTLDLAYLTLMTFISIDCIVAEMESKLKQGQDSFHESLSRIFVSRTMSVEPVSSSGFFVLFCLFISLFVVVVFSRFDWRPKWIKLLFVLF